MRIIVVDLDGSLAAQPALRSLVAIGAATEVFARDLAPRLRIVADRKAAAELRARIATIWSGEPAMLFYGSGDFHHLTAIFMSFVVTPLTVVQFDNHPDWVTWPKTLNCGSWVNRALERRNIERIVTIGPAGDDLVAPERKRANLQAIRDGRLEIHPWRAAASRIRGAAVDAPGCRTEGGAIIWDELATRDFDAFVAGLDERLPLSPLWITLDKDCLGETEAATNWDQGSLRLDQVIAAIRRLGERREILGIDVCGDYSRPAFSDPFRFLLAAFDRPRIARPTDERLAVNDRTNARLAAAFGDRAS